MAIEVDRSPRGFMPQLDGLRAFAVAGVLVHHLLRDDILLTTPFGVTLGLLGVRLFFVLSGFLITGILLKGRDAIDGGSAHLPHVLRQFYLRRTLRIFPLYYLVLALALMFGDTEVREQLPWLATYTYNFWISAVGFFPKAFSHFWSLCVEEQFYLLWPWMILLAPRRWLVPLTLAMIAIAPAFRAVAWELELREVAFYALTPSSFDALGIGALLAIVSRDRGDGIGGEPWLRNAALASAVLAIVLPIVSEHLRAIYGETLVALVFAWLVARASTGFGGVVRHVLEAKPILYLGRISYGIYVYHLLIPEVFGPVLKALGADLAPKGPAEFLIYSSLTVAVASASWFAIERPINRLKHRLATAA
jgi:peptidoglycan/LPS O-acetylase OafA/YrhL